MPELPEVQTIVSDLSRKIAGDAITDFWSDWPKAIKGKSLSAFQREIKGREIARIRRIGKNIFIDLSGGKTLYIHLKMTGHLLVKDPKSKTQGKGKNYFDDRVNQYVHHIWKLKSKNGKRKTLEFSDMRKFAKIVLDDTEKISNLPEIRKLGTDAASKGFTIEEFKKTLDKRKNKPIGTVLMEQEVIAGIGNIYRSEILFEAGVRPEKKSGSIAEKEVRRIYSAIGKTLKKAIRLRGTSDSDYRDTSGAPGKFQKVLKVYRKEGQKCEKCATMIKRTKIGQRSAFYCPKCQK